MKSTLLKHLPAFLVGLAAFAFAYRADASVLTSFLMSGANTFQDESLEVFVKGDGNTGIGIEEGDIIFGFARIDTVNAFGATSTANQVYAIFSQQFAAAPTDIGVAYEFEFTPTTQAGYTLADLLGALDPGGIGDGYIALLTASGGFSADFIATPASIGSVLAALTTEGSLDFVFGESTSDDFFTGVTRNFTDAFAGSDYVADLSNLGDAVYTADTNLGSFDSGLSVIFNANPATVVFNTVSPDTVGAGTFHDLVLTGEYQVPPAGAAAEGYAFADNIQGRFDVDIVPEPSSLIAWAGLGAVFFGGCYRRGTTRRLP